MILVISHGLSHVHLVKTISPKIPHALISTWEWFEWNVKNWKINIQFARRTKFVGSMERMSMYVDYENIRFVSGFHYRSNIRIIPKMIHTRSVFASNFIKIEQNVINIPNDWIKLPNSFNAAIRKIALFAIIWSISEHEINRFQMMIELLFEFSARNHCGRKGRLKSFTNSMMQW